MNTLVIIVENKISFQIKTRLLWIFCFFRAEHCSPVDVLINVQHVVDHSLEGELMQDRRDGVIATVHDQQLGARFISTLPSNTQ